MFSSIQAKFSRAAFVTAISAALAAGAASAPARAADSFTMKMGTASVNDQQHEWMKMFKTSIEKDSGGRIKVEIYPSSQLGAIPRMIEGVQFNSIQGWVGPPDFLTGVDPRFEVLGIPQVFKSDQNVYKTLQDAEFRKAFLALGADKGIVGLGLMLNDSQALMTRKPITNLAEMKGLKIRITAGKVLSAMMADVGATGVPMPLDQVITAVQQGAIDGVLSSLAVLTPMKIYTSAPYTVNFTNSYLASTVVISKQWLDSLPADLQKMVVADGAKTDKQIIPFIQKYLADQRSAYVAGGGKIVKLSAADETKLEALWAPVGKESVDANPTIKPIYDLMVTAAARNK